MPQYQTHVEISLALGDATKIARLSFSLCERRSTARAVTAKVTEKEKAQPLFGLAASRLSPHPFEVLPVLPGLALPICSSRFWARPRWRHLHSSLAARCPGCCAPADPPPAPPAAPRLGPAVPLPASAPAPRPPLGLSPGALPPARSVPLRGSTRLFLLNASFPAATRR